jgi:glyoxylase-like metal-dependent hydrolase (beta-lactamase superfamily II)
MAGTHLPDNARVPDAADQQRTKGGWAPQGVTLVRALNPGPLTLSGSNAWLIGAPAWLVDPGPLDEGHLERLEFSIRQRGTLEGIVLTHRHLDHAEAAPTVAERYGVPVFAGPGTPDPEQFSEPAAEGLQVERCLRDGDRVGPFEVIETPGHSADHVCYLAEDVLFCGDTVLGEGSVFIPPAGGSLARYLASLERLRELELQALCPGHGPVVWEPHEKLTEYIDHRLDRERRLVEALARGVRARDELLDEVWDDAPQVLRPAAALTLEAHLDKLAGEGRLPPDVERATA